VRGDDGGPDHLLPAHHLVHGELAAMDHELEREVVRAIAGPHRQVDPAATSATESRNVS
jgi:hypothetical protein